MWGVPEMGANGMPDSFYFCLYSLSTRDCRRRQKRRHRFLVAGVHWSKLWLDQPYRREQRGRAIVKIPSTGILVSEIGSRTDRPSVMMDVRSAVTRTHCTLLLCTIAVLPKLCRDHHVYHSNVFCTKSSRLHNFCVCLGPLQPGSAAFALYHMLNLSTPPLRDQ